MTKIEIVPRQMYRVRFKSKNGYRRYGDFPTLYSASSRIAWWMIGSKYNYWDKEISPQVRGVCTCGEEDKLSSSHLPEWYCCELHDRENGYFRRVHERLVRWILMGMATSNA